MAAPSAPGQAVPLTPRRVLISRAVLYTTCCSHPEQAFLLDCGVLRGRKTASRGTWSAILGVGTWLQSRFLGSSRCGFGQVTSLL